MARTGKAPATNDGRVASYLLKGQLYKTFWNLALGGTGKTIPVKEVSTFGDGETLDVPGCPRVVHAPGHTAGSAVLVLEDRSLLFTGDVMCTLNPLTGRPGPQIMPSGLNRDTQQAMQSLDNLAGVKADVVLAGHGDDRWRARGDPPSQGRRPVLAAGPGPHRSSTSAPLPRNTTPMAHHPCSLNVGGP
jgi:glyoxylase-like metal-dependent hydrolase (beta-lactamase superfamily II)